MRLDLDDIIEIMILIISSVAVLVVGYFVSLLVLGLWGIYMSKNYVKARTAKSVTAQRKT